MKRKILLLLLFTPLLMFSQKALGYYIDYDDVPDSFKKRYFAKEEHNFFPMHIGDMWQYSYYDAPEDTVKYHTIEIVSDTLVDGKRYFNFLETYEGRSFFVYKNYRAGEQYGVSYELDVGDYDEDGIYGEDLLVDSLDAELGTEYCSYLGEYHVCYIITNKGWYVMNDDTLLTTEVTSLAFSNLFTENFWITTIIPEQGFPEYLTGAIINGVQYGTIVDVGETETQPQQFTLYQNYPNPFNPTTTIKYSIPANAGVETLHATSLRIYNVLGEEVATLVNKQQAPGNYTVQFDATNLPSGVYFYTLRVGNFVATKKMILLK